MNDVAYRTVDSPVGALLLAATDAGLVRVAFEYEGFETVVEELSTRLRAHARQDARRLDEASRELERYFAGTLRAFTVFVDHALSSGFRREVLRQLPHIPYGSSASYQEVAEQVGSPRAARAVGSACATNPVPIVIPCHRVLRSDGTLGGYSGGLDVKRYLLALEQPDDTGRVEIK